MKELPHSYESECSVLSAILVSNDVRNELVNSLEEDDFYGEKDCPNKVIFRAVKKLMENFLPIDIPSIVNEININEKKLDEIGGVEYIKDISNQYITDRHSLRHCHVLKDLTLARKLIVELERSLEGFSTKSIEDVGAYISQIENNIVNITNRRRVGSFENAGDLVSAFTEQLKLGKSKTTTSKNISTGFSLLDYVTQKWQPGQFNIIGARPSVGKTAFALNLAYNAASTSGRPVAFFSLEMNAKQIVTRLLSSQAKVCSTLFNEGNLSDDDYLQLDSAVQAIKNVDLLIDDTPGQNLADIKTKCQNLKAAKPDLGCIFIDYLGLIQNTSKKNWDRQNEVADTSRQLKALARELDVPIICLSQLSRNNESRKDTDRMPKLTDLRDSGSIEQDADIVMFIHRVDYQDANAQEQSEENIRDTSPFGKTSETKINVAKNRNGNVAVVPFTMFKNIGLFAEVTSDKE